MKNNIEPYSDHEVRNVTTELVCSNEVNKAVGRMILGQWYNRLKPFSTVLIKQFLILKIKKIQSIKTFQHFLKPYLGRIIKKTTSDFCITGIDKLDPKKAYLYVSNHRDIAMDPAFVNWALDRHGFETVRIAIGDNLTKKPYMNDLLRLNKSFIISRGVDGTQTERRDNKLAISEYIQKSIDDGHSVWIAHRGGRAKDGIDATDPAVLKMLSMAGKKQGNSFKASMKKLNLVPISISYEFDPCAPLKAKELTIREETGTYVKKEGEDIHSISMGIMGWKGKVNLHFGTPLQTLPETPQELASVFNSLISQGQRIFETQKLADAMLKQNTFNIQPPHSQVANKFLSIHKKTPKRHRQKLLEIYANPLRQLVLHQKP